MKSHATDSVAVEDSRPCDSAREKQRDIQSGRVPYTVSVPLGSFQLVLGVIVEDVERRKESQGIMNNRTD